MNADYVENIIRNIDKQSYKCILVDGAWGIGKSYMVRKALEDMKDRTCFISLFGMDDVQKIYHEAFFQLALRTSRGGKIANGAKGVAKAAGNFCAEITKLNGALAQAISERELFAVTASNFKKNRIIVIDDLERRKAGLDLEELFGVIEELKQSNYIKVMPLDPRNMAITEKVKSVVEKYKLNYLHDRILPRSLFGIESNFIEENPEKAILLETVENIDYSKQIKLFTNDRAGKAGRAKWYVVDKNVVENNPEYISQWKVVVSSANAGGQKRDNQLEIVDNHSAFGRARVALASFETQDEANNFYNFAKSYVVRFTFLMTDESLTALGKRVPDLMDYTNKNSLVDFSKSLDEQLYLLFEFNRDEIEYIESTVNNLRKKKEMA